MNANTGTRRPEKIEDEARALRLPVTIMPITTTIITDGTSGGTASRIDMVKNEKPHFYGPGFPQFYCFFAGPKTSSPMM